MIENLAFVIHSSGVTHVCASSIACVRASSSPESKACFACSQVELTLAEPPMAKNTTAPAIKCHPMGENSVHIFQRGHDNILPGHYKFTPCAVSIIRLRGRVPQRNNTVRCVSI